MAKAPRKAKAPTADDPEGRAASLEAIKNALRAENAIPAVIETLPGATRSRRVATPAELVLRVLPGLPGEIVAKIVADDRGLEAALLAYRDGVEAQHEEMRAYVDGINRASEELAPDVKLGRDMRKRQKKAGSRAGKERRKYFPANHAAWEKEAERIWATSPLLSQRRVAGLVASNLNYGEAAESSIRDYLAKIVAKKPPI